MGAVIACNTTYVFLLYYLPRIKGPHFFPLKRGNHASLLKQRFKPQRIIVFILKQVTIRIINID